MSTFTHPPKIDADGRHWEQHGATLYHVPVSSSPENLATAAGVSVMSYATEQCACAVLVNVARQPFNTALVLSADDAVRMSDALREAAERAYEVQAIKAQRKQRAAKGEGKP